MRFLLNGEERRLDSFDPTMTVLDYLRGPAHCTGTKEGCAEGDCGACTVGLGESDGEGMRYRAVNACILLLGAVDGKALVTVEGLGGEHPVQQAMVTCHASQCGFCTPGFVMSLFAFRREATLPDRRAVNDALAGNLCRCTGYRPIAEAALKSFETPDPSLVNDAETCRRLKALERGGTLEIEQDGRRFLAPADLDSLADLYLAHPDAVLVAGGTDVGLTITKQLKQPKTVISLNRVAALKKVSEGEIGAGVSYSDAEEMLGNLYPDFGEVLRRLGSRQIRNCGTLGGNIANASPIGDTPPLLLALGASVVLRRGKAERVVALDDFFVDYRRTVLAPGEFITAIRLPEPAGIFRAYKISKRFDQDISALCGAFSLRLDESRVAGIRIAFGGMAAIPKRALKAEAALIGQVWSTALLPDLVGDFAPISDFRASAKYRLKAAGNLLRKFQLETNGTNVRVLEVAP